MGVINEEDVELEMEGEMFMCYEDVGIIWDHEQTLRSFAVHIDEQRLRT